MCHRARNQKGIQDSTDNLDTHVGPGYGTALGGAEFYGLRADNNGEKGPIRW